MLTPKDIPARRVLRALTYNVHSCRGSDRRHDPERIAEVIAESGAEVIALQELDVGRKRSGGIDQAEVIAAHLKMRSHFHPALHVEEERYGDALLTALPSTLHRAAALPSRGEPRGALWIEIDVDGRKLQVFNTHFGLSSAERTLQAETLLGPGWLGHERCRRAPTLLLGDFNAVPSSRAFQVISRSMTVAAPRGEGRWRATFPARWPLLRLDHVFHNNRLKLIDARVIDTPLARKASDHLPIVADFELLS
ncbi:endonuclease/exonuclease/phosphatase family protein [Rhizobium sp. TRM95796]|uniref:endonuclease/exonuclease/phosphatase family protein n=1 Tax=Rhizobium sp. TRM95796 TaxID=2979862 RepID=UPI0021E7FE99|nr:endonuclease/exonuclease/phosphatase family protein [Rhizobium sp. TRM95796]MCV3764485.1 endonuclease/exonuclease/phosphatase family protein [Rhizobium sp. TRM95796]